MSKLASIRKQIAALEAEAERIARQEMSGAIAKVKEIMTEFGLTIEHLQSAVGGKTRKVAKKVKAKRIGGGIAKYADPKTGKTWSGFGRAPAWILGAKNRDAFLVDKSSVKPSEAPVAKRKSATKKASAKKLAKPAAKKTLAVAKTAAAPTKRNALVFEEVVPLLLCVGNAQSDVEKSGESSSRPREMAWTCSTLGQRLLITHIHRPYDNFG